MSKKSTLLESIKNILTEIKKENYSRKRHYYTMEEKKEMELRGERVTVCVYGSSERKIKALRMKI